MIENKDNTPENKEEDKGSFFGSMAAAAGAAAAGNTGNREYVVEKGDTLSEIGQKYGVSWRKIFEANKDVISDPDLIQPGWKLKIPDDNA